MPKTVTQYDLLISCPGDVQEEIEIIKDEVAQFNERYADILGVSIRPRHWSYSSYAESGDKAQALLNKQFVDDCDAAVAVFWTRFGTPTDMYGSGTEEEIEKMMAEGKQVFMYFSDVPAMPSQVDATQYAKINEFRQKYSKRGVYFTYSSIEGFGKMFAAHLAQHFLTLKKVEEIREIRNPQLELSLESEGDFHIVYTYPKLLVRQELNDEDITQDIIDDLKQQDKYLAENSGLLGLMRFGVNSKVQDENVEKTVIDIDAIDYQKILLEEIVAYNSALPSQQDFDIYNEQVTQFTNMTENKQRVNVYVENNGTAVAKQVTVTLLFPPELLVFDDDDITDVTEPKKLKIPLNPLRERRVSGDYTEIKLLSNAFDSISKFNPSLSAFIAGPSTPLDYYTDGKGYLSFNINSLLHTQAERSDDFYVVATQKGTFEIQGELICEELSEPITKTFTVVVE
jgi:hypothetical protein